MEAIQTNKVALSDLLQEANNIQAGCKDYIIPDIMQDRVRMTMDAELSFLDQIMPLNRWALGQIGNKMRVPGSYLERCVDEGMPWLAATNVNSWLERKHSGNMMIRTNNGHVRGILSTQYSAMDAPDVLSLLTDYFEDEGDWDIKGSYLDEERLHLRLVHKHEMEVNDSIFPALFLSSSDVGRGSLNMRFGLYRLACTNGMIVPKISAVYKQRHVGLKRTAFEDQIVANLSMIPQMVEASEKLILRAQGQSLNTVEMQQVLHEIQAKSKITDTDLEKVLQITEENYAPTRWGVLNALTEFAQTRKTLEGRLLLEQVAGTLLAA